MRALIWRTLACTVAAPLSLCFAVIFTFCRVPFLESADLADAGSDEEGGRDDGEGETGAGPGIAGGGGEAERGGGGGSGEKVVAAAAGQQQAARKRRKQQQEQDGGGAQ